MDAVSRMFFEVNAKELEGRPVDDTFLSVVDTRGALNKVSVLDKSWPLLSLKNQYTKHPGAAALSQSGTELLTLWRSSAQTYADELQNLVMGASYDRFWCHILHEPDRVLAFLRSFTAKAGRSYDFVALSKEDAAIHSRILSLCFLAFMTISCNRRSRVEHISEKKHGEILQKLVKLPLLMDIAALCGGNRQIQSMLTAALSSCFQKHRRLYTELRISLRDISDSLFQPLEDSLSDSDGSSGARRICQLPDKDLLDIVGYVCDILATLQRLTAISAPDILSVFRDAKFPARLSKFTENVVWSLNREVLERLKSVEGDSAMVGHFEHAAKQGNVMEWALVDTFRRVVCPDFFLQSPTAAGMASSLAALLDSLPQHQLFTIMYEKWAPIKRDIDLAKNFKANVEESVVDFLAHAVKEAFASQQMPWNFSSSGAAATQPVPVVAPNTGSPMTNKSSVGDVVVPNDDRRVDEVAAEVLAMLGDMGLEKNYVKACVRHCKCDLNATVDAILSGSVPIGITEEAEAAAAPTKSLALATALVHQPPTTSQRHQPPVPTHPSRRNERPVAHTAPNTVIEKVYYGKRDLYEETEEEAISDETRLVTIARAQQMYEDEYDDTYDQFEREGSSLTLNDREDSVALDLKAMQQEECASHKGADPQPHRQAASSTPNFSRSDRPPPTRGPGQHSGRGSQEQTQDQHHRQGQPSQNHQARPGIEAGNVPRGQPAARGRHDNPDQGRAHGNKQRDQQQQQRGQQQPQLQAPGGRSNRDDYEEEEEAAPAPRSNDPWVRQMEDNYKAQMARRPAQPRPATDGGQGPGKATGADARTRANKEKNKAHAGNHNRKDRGEWKRREF